TSGQFTGITILGGVQCTGTGQITVQGRGGTLSGVNSGVFVGSSVAGGTGPVVITGAASNGNFDVDLQNHVTSNGGDVQIAGTTGEVNIEHFVVVSAGGTGRVAVQAAAALVVSGFITTNNGDVQVASSGGAVDITGGTVSAGGSGNVTVQ